MQLKKQHPQLITIPVICNLTYSSSGTFGIIRHLCYQLKIIYQSELSSKKNMFLEKYTKTNTISEDSIIL